MQSRHAAVGERIGPWDVISQLGVGTVGTVYKVRGVVEKGEEPREAALKILRPDVSGDDVVQARFAREIEILEKLSHPNVVETYASGEHDQMLYYVMELVDGPSLKDVLEREHRLDWKDAVEVGWQICSALQHAHNMGIVHRDLKPANLFLTSRGEVKLGDFGIALDTGEAELTATGLTVGTYAFMAPEQIRGDRGVSGSADLYALGCLVYRMLAGRNPYSGDNFAQIFEQHLHSEPPSVRDLVAGVPVELDRLVREMLSKQPEDRPINARAVQGRLAEALLLWDETQGRELMERPSTWAIEDHKPILSNIIRPRRAEQVVNVSWAKIIGLAVAVAALIAVAAVASKYS